MPTVVRKFVVRGNCLGQLVSGASANFFLFCLLLFFLLLLLLLHLLLHLLLLLLLLLLLDCE